MIRHIVPALVSLACLATFTSAQTNEDLKLVASDGAAGNRFGFSIAISGNTAVIGAPWDDDNGDYSGSAYVIDITTGQEFFKLTASDAAAGDRFGYSIAVSGNLAVIGADLDDDSGSGSGSAYVFDFTTGQELAKLTASDGADGDRFGLSIAASGNLAVIGAYADDDNGNNSGSAYIFDVTTGQELAKLTPSDAAVSAYFGASVALSGNIAVIGAFGDGANGYATGSAYVFDVTTGQELFKLTASDGEEGDYAGTSVALSGNTAVIGAYSDNDDGWESGSAYVFDVTTGQELFKLTASDGAEGDRFSHSVAASGNIAVIGAFKDDDKAQDTGSAYLFDITTGQELAKLTASDGAALDFFGRPVAISGNTAVIGAPYDDGNSTDSGSAYVFGLTPDGVSRYCGTTQNPNNAAVIRIDTTDSSAASIRAILAAPSPFIVIAPVFALSRWRPPCARRSVRARSRASLLLVPPPIRRASTSVSVSSLAPDRLRRRRACDRSVPVVNRNNGRIKNPVSGIARALAKGAPAAIPPNQNTTSGIVPIHGASSPR